jgi:hypothetical protein
MYASRSSFLPLSPEHKHTDVEHYVTIERYTAEEEDELSFPKGVTVDVLQKSLDGWWLIKYEGKAALAPATFLVKKETANETNPVCATTTIHTSGLVHNSDAASV